MIIPKCTKLRRGKTRAKGRARASVSHPPAPYANTIATHHEETNPKPAAGGMDASETVQQAATNAIAHADAHSIGVKAAGCGTRFSRARLADQEASDSDDLVATQALPVEGNVLSVVSDCSRYDTMPDPHSGKGITCSRCAVTTSVCRRYYSCAALAPQASHAGGVGQVGLGCNCCLVALPPEFFLR